MHIKEVFIFLLDFCMNQHFFYGQFHFSLWNVMEAGFVLSIIGLAIGKIIFFVENKR